MDVKKQLVCVFDGSDASLLKPSQRPKVYYSDKYL